MRFAAMEKAANTLMHETRKRPQATRLSKPTTAAMQRMESQRPQGDALPAAISQTTSDAHAVKIAAMPYWTIRANSGIDSPNAGVKRRAVRASALNEWLGTLLAALLGDTQNLSIGGPSDPESAVWHTQPIGNDCLGYR